MESILSQTLEGLDRSEEKGRMGGFLKQRILKIAIGQNGQCGVNLWENNRPVHFGISVLVADAFIPEKSGWL